MGFRKVKTSNEAESEAPRRRGRLLPEAEQPTSALFGKKPTESKQKERKLQISVDQGLELTIVQAALEAGLTEPEVLDQLLAKVRPDDFQFQEYIAIWKAIKQLRKQKLTPDIAAFCRLLPVAVAEHVAELFELSTGIPAQLNWHVEQLHWARTRLDIARGPFQELAESLEKQEDRERCISLVRQIETSLSESGSVGSLRDSAQLAREVQEDLEARMAKSFYPFGVVGLDVDQNGEQVLDENSRPLITFGAAPGRATIITATSGQGKSTVTRSFLDGMIRNGYKVLFGAWEDSAKDVVLELCSIRLGIPKWRVACGRITEEEKRRILIEQEQIHERVRFVDNPLRKGRRSPRETVDLIGGMISDAGADVAIYDLFRRAFFMPGFAEEEETLFAAKALHEELGCHMFVVHQQQLKETEKRADPRPTREGIKGAGAWVEFPDMILGVYRPGYYKNQPDETLEIHGLKQRHGKAPFLVEFEFDPSDGSLKNGIERPYDRKPETTDKRPTGLVVKKNLGR